jgi:hypothetical protein
MPTQLKLKKSSVQGRQPLVEDLEYGELAINYTDNKLYFKTSFNTINAFIVDPVTVFTKTITLSTDWQDTGIKNTDLDTGTYIVQLYANDTGSGGTNSNEYYSGTMSWYGGTTNSSLELPTDEVVLHRAGGGGDGSLYLRTYRSTGPDNLKLQIYSNTPNASASNYVFKFRKFI